MNDKDVIDQVNCDYQYMGHGTEARSDMGHEGGRAIPGRLHVLRVLNV